MSDERPPDQSSGPTEPTEVDAPAATTLPKRKGFIARWKSPPPLRRQELSSRVWIGEGGGEEVTSERPGEGPEVPAAYEAPLAAPPPSLASAPLLDPGTSLRPADLSELEARIARAVEGRLDRVVRANAQSLARSFGDALRRLADSVRDDFGSAFGEDRTALAAELEDLSNLFRERLAGVEHMLAKAELTEERMSGLATREQLDERLAVMDERLGRLEQAWEGAIDAGLERLREELDQRLREMRDRLEESVMALSLPDMDAMERKLTERQEVAERLMSERLEAIRDELSATLSSEISDVTRAAAAAVDDAGATRRELAAAVRTLEEMAAAYGDEILQKRIAAALGDVLGDLQGLAGQVEPLLRPHLSEAVAEVVESLRQELQVAISGRAQVRDLADTVRVQKALERAVGETRRQLDTLSAVVSSFGKPRMAPRLAQDLARLERRLAAAEKAFSRKLAATVEGGMRPLEERVASAIEEVRAEVRAIDIDSLTRAVGALEGRIREAVEGNGQDQRRRPRFRRKR